MDPMERIRVLVADDHVLYRRGLEMVLGQEPDIEIVGEANDGMEAVAAIEELLPDVVLMDVRMPRLSGPEAAMKVKESVPSTKIIMLTISDEEQDLYDAVRAGANGYLLKDVSSARLLEAVQAAARGESVLAPTVAAISTALASGISKKLSTARPGS